MRNGESFESFDRVAPLLAGFRFYAPDLRGQGGAGNPWDGYSLAEQAADVSAIFQALTDPVDVAWVRQSLSWFPLLHKVPAWFIDDRVDDGTRMPGHVWKSILGGLCSATPPTESGTIDASTLIL